MDVLIVGSGAREHALAWRLSKSSRVGQLWLAPGNFGTSTLATNLPVNAEDLDGITHTAQSLNVGLVVVGPEVPLAAGLADRLGLLGIPVFGPSKEAARIESSKRFALELMREAGVPCPEFQVFRDPDKAVAYLSANPGPIVAKADGLAAGKGVMVCANAAEATAAVRSCMNDRVFGDAGATVVLEELLTGPEVSVFAFTDGVSVAPLVAACDYKRLEDGGHGPNTGGMGSFSPPKFWNPGLSEEVERTVIRPVLTALANQGSPYRGVLYAGLMLTADGPKVLEFNCRLGDPEAQVILPRLASDPLDLMLACANGTLDQVEVRWDFRAYVGVVMASGGYPGPYKTGHEITGLDDDGIKDDADTMVFHAGTEAGAGGGAVTAGGRVLTVVGGGESILEARERAYRRLSRISFDGAQWRKDIADQTSGVETIKRPTRWQGQTTAAD